MTGIFKTAGRFLASPVKAAGECPKDRLSPPCLWIYALVTVGFMVLFRYKPYDFPDPNVPVPAELQDFSYWLKAEAWQPVLEAGWIAFMLALSRFYSAGSWPVRFAASVAWTALPFLLIVAYAQFKAFPKPVFALGVAAWIALFYPALRKAPRAQWLSLANFALGINAVGLPILAGLALAVALRHRALFQAVQIGGGLWLLGASAAGLRRLLDLRLPRAAMAVILSAFFQIALAFSLHFLGAKGVLKALLYG